MGEESNGASKPGRKRVPWSEYSLIIGIQSALAFTSSHLCLHEDPSPSVASPIADHDVGVSLWWTSPIIVVPLTATIGHLLGLVIEDRTVLVQLRLFKSQPFTLAVYAAAVLHCIAFVDVDCAAGSGVGGVQLWHGVDRVLLAARLVSAVITGLLYRVGIRRRTIANFRRSRLRSTMQSRSLMGFGGGGGDKTGRGKVIAALRHSSMAVMNSLPFGAAAEEGAAGGEDVPPEYSVSKLNLDEPALYKDGRCVYPDGDPAPVPKGFTVARTPPEYLKSAKNDKRTASDMWSHTQEWRLDYRIWNIHATSHPYYNTCRSAARFHFHGRTKDGYPIIYAGPTNTRLKELLKSDFPMEDVLRHVVCLLEYISNCCFKNPAGGRGWGFVLVLDMKDTSMSHLNGDVVALLQAINEINHNHYPGTLKHVLLINSPMWISSVWNSLKGMFSKSVQEVVSILGPTRFLAKLRELADDKQIPVEYGGSSPQRMGEDPLELSYVECIKLAEKRAEVYEKGEDDPKPVEDKSDETGGNKCTVRKVISKRLKRGNTKSSSSLGNTESSRSVGGADENGNDKGGTEEPPSPPKKAVTKGKEDHHFGHIAKKIAGTMTSPLAAPFKAKKGKNEKGPRKDS